MRVKACVLGHFGEGLRLLNGQTVKTNMVTEELCRQMGADQILKMDTHGGWKTLLKAPFQTFSALKNSENVLIFPAQNGLRVYAPLLVAACRCFRKRKLHYVVIGGWLPQFLKNRRILAKALKHFDGIYVETNTMKNALQKQGFENVYVMPNCKNLQILSESELVYPTEAPYKLCTFSRVMKEKGIETAVDAVRQVNERLGYAAYSLDIYGQVDAGQTQWFDALKESFPDNIRYCGSVGASQSVEVLKDYFALLFPTHFYTEGIPGTIIDAYAAGVPVMAARWESFCDLVDDGVTGWGYAFEQKEQLVQLLVDTAKTPERISSLKLGCVAKAKNYLPETALQTLLLKMKGE